MLIIPGQMRKLCPNPVRLSCEGWGEAKDDTPLAEARAPTIWFPNCWQLFEIKVNAIQKWGSQLRRKKCGLLLVIVKDVCPTYYWWLAMKKPDEEWPPECLGLLINNKPAYQRLNFWLLCLRQRSFVNSSASKFGLRATLMQAGGRGREKKERKTFCISQHKLQIGSRDFLKERAVWEWRGPSFTDFLPRPIIQLSLLHSIQQSRTWISTRMALMYFSHCLLLDLERFKNFLFSFSEGSWVEGKKETGEGYVQNKPRTLMIILVWKRTDHSFRELSLT